MQYIMLIPAYNPDAQFAAFTEVLRQMHTPVVVVDDGSHPESRPYFVQAEEAGFTVLHHTENRGKGAALRTGFAYIRGRYPAYTHVITADCDGQHNQEAILRVARAAEETPDALILGGRFRDEKNIPLKSRIGNGFTRGIFRMATGLAVHDTQTGLRAIPLSMLDRMLELRGDRYEYEMNMLLCIKEWSLPYREVTIPTVYFDNNAGTHFHPLRDSWLILRQIFKFISASLISFAVDYVLYILLSGIFGHLSVAAFAVPLAYALARVVSGAVNYFLNSRMVFRSTGWRSAVGYGILWLCILGTGAGGAFLLHDTLHLPRIISKIFIDIPLFAVSYFVQREIIFRKKGKQAP